MSRPHHYRSIFISDVHLGTRDAKAESLLAFLQHSDCDYLYLVGDIFDLWKLKKGWYWPSTVNELIALVFAKARAGTTVTYIPGNHDEMLRDYCGGLYNGISLQREALHTAADGKRFLVLHGDEFDCVVRNNKWLAHIGDGAYDLLLWVNRWFNHTRHHLGFEYWSLAAFLKQQTKGALNYIERFEQSVCSEAVRRQVDGVICGHIHHSRQRELEGCAYKNCGDWVESCTALVEDGQGRFEVLHWGVPQAPQDKKERNTAPRENGKPSRQQAA